MKRHFIAVTTDFGGLQWYRTRPSLTHPKLGEAKPRNVGFSVSVRPPHHCCASSITVVTSRPALRQWGIRLPCLAAPVGMSPRHAGVPPSAGRAGGGLSVTGT